MKNPPIIYIEVDSNVEIILSESFEAFVKQLYEHVEAEEIEYVELTLDSSPERIREVFTNINQFCVDEIIPLIFQFNSGSDPQS